MENTLNSRILWTYFDRQSAVNFIMLENFKTFRDYILLLTKQIYAYSHLLIKTLNYFLHPKNNNKYQLSLLLFIKYRQAMIPIILSNSLKALQGTITYFTLLHTQQKIICNC